jgi:hypothetical protein
MIGLLTLLLPTISSQTTCSDQAGIQCYNQLLQLQSAQSCGNASLVTNVAMGHKMPSDLKWMSCACDKLPDIVDCLDMSTCDIHKQAAEDFSGVVMHCEMDHSGHGSSSHTTTSTSTAPSPSASSNAAVGVKSLGFQYGVCALVLLCFV